MAVVVYADEAAAPSDLLKFFIFNLFITEMRISHERDKYISTEGGGAVVLRNRSWMNLAGEERGPGWETW